MSIKVSALFPLPPKETTEKLESYEKALQKAAPMRTKHLEELHYSIRDLSRMLTGDRADLTNDYMGDPRSMNAYLRYFLPWNLYRLTRLFSVLDISLPENGIVADLGAGPLTVAQALWIARPDLRKKKLTFINLDRTPKIMKQGQHIFEEMAPDCKWKIVNVKGGISNKLREKANLLVSANMINEIIMGMRTPLPVWAEKFSIQIGKMLAKNGRMLIVEPGVRQSGRAISVIRAELLQNGWSALAPCPHNCECPMPGEHGTPWCHFNFDSQSAPQWLQALSARCGLEKDNVSLSFLYMAQPHEELNEPANDNFSVRAVSESFRLENGGYGQYGCSEKGLILLQAKGEARSLFPGGLISMPAPEADEKDEKSGALIVDIPVKKNFAAKQGKPAKSFNSSKSSEPKTYDKEKPDYKKSREKKSAKSEESKYKSNKKNSSGIRNDRNNDDEGWTTSRNEALGGGRRDHRGGKRSSGQKGGKR